MSTAVLLSDRQPDSRRFNIHATTPRRSRRRSQPRVTRSKHSTAGGNDIYSSIDMLIGACKSLKRFRIGAEVVATRDFSSEPSVAQALMLALFAPAPCFFDCGFELRVTEPPNQSVTRHHAHYSPM
jgi:hypothetical protein